LYSVSQMQQSPAKGGAAAEEEETGNPDDS
jgi:hypothetical protein